MISLQTNTTSLMAQQNLNTDNAFQSKTIEELTSGYRINSSGDDAAGLAIANGYQSSVSELTQGVANANDGTSQLQIIDGGLSNISTILDRMKTLATQSASGTFTGSRATLNQEYSGLVTEVNRQAANINLNSGGSLNTQSERLYRRRRLNAVQRLRQYRSQRRGKRGRRHQPRPGQHQCPGRRRRHHR